MALAKVIPEIEDFRYIKQRVLISAASWSGSQNASGYYTYSLSNLTAINTYNNVSYNLSPATPNSVATSAEQLAFSLIDYMQMSDGYGVTSATLYAKTKPTTNFYIEICAGGEEAYPSGSSYSTSETFTGCTWINGKPIYRKVVDFGALPNNTEKKVTVFPSNTDITVIRMVGTAVGTAYTFPIPNVNAQGDKICVFYTKTTGQLTVETTHDRSAYNGYVEMLYTYNS